MLATAESLEVSLSKPYESRKAVVTALTPAPQQATDKVDKAERMHEEDRQEVINQNIHNAKRTWINQKSYLLN